MKRKSRLRASTGAMQVSPKLLLCALTAALSLTACNEDEKQKYNRALASYDGNRSLSVFGSIRPKADPNVMAKIRAEDQAAITKAAQDAEEAQKAAAEKQKAEMEAMDPAKRDLPAVDQNPISAMANAFGFGNSQASASAASQIPMPITTPPPPPTASYGGYQTAPAIGMIPPPPQLYTSATPVFPAPPDPYGAGAYPPPAGYGYPGASPYGYTPPPPQPAHPAGSMFSNRDQAPTIAPSDDEPKKKSVVVITPTGMDPRSTYKQRDDLRLLLKAAFSASPVREMHDPKIAKALALADVKLPSSATKGNVSVSQREIDNLFVVQGVDDKVLPTVRKIQSDLAQAYYRYIYCYNKYTLTQQQIAARKQEVEVADSNAEKQRAAADLSSAMQDADSAKDDLHSAQNDLASVAGAQAARTVIQKVSGVAPSLDALAADVPQAAPAKKDDGLLGSMTSAISNITFFGHSPGKDVEKLASAVKSSKDKKDKKDKRGKQEKQAEGSDEAEAPDTASQASAAPERPAGESVRSASAGLSFELRNIQTTPRKSVLKVAIRNNTGDSVSIDPDNISVAEGDHKLAEAAVRSEFDQTMVQPNQEISGTITIFGRPWNDRLTVSFSDGGKTIVLHR